MEHVMVVGSANADLHLSVDRLPAPGDTVLARTTRWLPGGKGANQALAAARLGAAVTFVGALGDDGPAEVALAGLADEGVTLAVRRIEGEPSGVAVVCVDDGGENLIVVAPGTNAQLRPDDVVVPDGCAAVLVSLEIPTETAAAALDRAHEAGALAVLNAAPASGATADLIARADVVIANEGEAAAIGTVANAVLVGTRGADGAVAVTPDGTEHRTPGLQVEVVDTVGAGDCFAAALTVALAERRPLPEALTFANKAASLKVGKVGARSMPTRAEVDGAPTCPGRG